MRDGLNRIGVWTVVDELTADVFRKTHPLPPEQPLRSLIREAALSLSRCSTLEQSHAKLATLGYLFHSAAHAGMLDAEAASTMLSRILQVAKAMRRLDDDAPAAPG